MAVQPLSPQTLNTFWQALPEEQRPSFFVSLSPQAQASLRSVNPDATGDDPDIVQRTIDKQQQRGASKPNALKAGHS